MKAAVHRLSQGLRALFAFTRSVDLDTARQHLTACEFDAFRSMSLPEQLHSLNVLKHMLKADAAARQELKAAALLHDVGKSRYQLALWQKTIGVLVEAFAPKFCREIKHEEKIRFWRAPFIVRQRHAAWGGEILRDCGSDAAIIWLVEHHQDDAERHQEHALHGLLASLQAADGES